VPTVFLVLFGLNGVISNYLPREIACATRNLRKLRRDEARHIRSSSRNLETLVQNGLNFGKNLPKYFEVPTVVLAHLGVFRTHSKASGRGETLGMCNIANKH